VPAGTGNNGRWCASLRRTCARPTTKFRRCYLVSWVGIFSARVTRFVRIATATSCGKIANRRYWPPINDASGQTFRRFLLRTSRSLFSQNLELLPRRSTNLP
jgi:hypothetical protein